MTLKSQLHQVVARVVSAPGAKPGASMCPCRTASDKDVCAFCLKLRRWFTAAAAAAVAVDRWQWQCERCNVWFPHRTNTDSMSGGGHHGRHRGGLGMTAQRPRQTEEGGEVRCQVGGREGGRAATLARDGPGDARIRATIAAACARHPAASWLAPRSAWRSAVETAARRGDRHPLEAQEGGRRPRGQRPTFERTPPYKTSSALILTEKFSMYAPSEADATGQTTKCAILFKEVPFFRRSRRWQTHRRRVSIAASQRGNNLSVSGRRRGLRRPHRPVSRVATSLLST